MRPRKIGGLAVLGPPGGAAGSQASLRSVPASEAHAASTELWLAVHVLNGGLTLERLATRAQRFTPRVSLAPPDGMLLEVKGSLHLFKGVEGLIKAVTGECTRLGIESNVAVAPTPLAAIVAARVGKPLVVMDRSQLVGQVSGMPLAPLRWPDDVVQRLARMGARTIGHALRLPRAGFARRFGPARLADLDRLIGRDADPRRRFQPRERFRRRRELTYELENTQTILTAMAPLLADLERFLRVRQCGVTQIECRFRHRHAPDSRCLLRLASPVADAARLTELLQERLGSLALPEPVRSCELRSGVPVARVLESNPVWRSGEHGGSRGAESPELIERLRARLGQESVYGLQLLPGHRPESAWRRIEPGAKPWLPESPWPAFRRPLWLLPVPQQLEEINGVPRRRGALRLSGDVERIETGWWDGGDTGRDYFRAYDMHGVLLWIFREHAEPHRWFLHGVYG